MVYIIAGVFTIFGGFGLVLGLYASLSGIVTGVAETFEDENRAKMKHEAIVSWFFGPCMKVFGSIFKCSFRQIIKQVRGFCKIWVGAMRPHWILKILLGPIGGILIGYQFPIGAMLSLFFGLVFAVLFFAFLIVFWVLFIVFFIIDRIVLLFLGFRNHCPHCNELSIIPQYVCPHCGRIHKHLAPNKYGIFHHKCLCGCYLGSTYLTGKARLDAICPKCGEPFGEAASKPFALQLVGGTSAGKTVFTAAMLHELVAASKARKIRCAPATTCVGAVNEMEQLYSGEIDVAATQGRDVTFYAEIFKLAGKTDLKFEIIDIPGEMFAGETALREGLHRMAQYKYADGFLFLVDPFSDGDLMNQKPADGTETSPIAASDVLHSFDQYLIAQGFAKAGALINKPISIIVCKADNQAVKKEISIEFIEETFKANKSKYKTLANCRDQLVKEYLVSIGQGDLVSNVEARFKNAHFFIASAMGHAPQIGNRYQPQGVYETFEWIMEGTNADALRSKLNK